MKPVLQLLELAHLPRWKCHVLTENKRLIRAQLRKLAPEYRLTRSAIIRHVYLT